MEVRLLKLKNRNGQEFDFMRKDAFLYDVKGFGWGMSAETMEVGDDFMVVDEKIETKNPSGTLAAASYDVMQEFRSFIQVGGLTLCYKPNNNIPWRYLDCHVDFDMDEIDHSNGYLHCPVKFARHSQWYESTLLYKPTLTVDPDVAKVYEEREEVNSTTEVIEEIEIYDSTFSTGAFPPTYIISPTSITAEQIQFITELHEVIADALNDINKDVYISGTVDDEPFRLNYLSGTADTIYCFGSGQAASELSDDEFSIVIRYAPEAETNQYYIRFVFRPGGSYTHKTIDFNAVLYEEETTEDPLEYRNSYQYDYRYQDSASGVIEIENGNLPSYFKVVFIGPVTNPEYILSKNGEIVKSGKIICTISSGRKLVINTEPTEAEIREYTVDTDELKVDHYGNQDWTREVLFAIPPGRHKMTLSQSSGTIPDGYIEVHKRV